MAAAAAHAIMEDVPVATLLLLLLLLPLTCIQSVRDTTRRRRRSHVTFAWDVNGSSHEDFDIDS